MSPHASTLYAALAAVLVVAGITAGLVTVGSPERSRLARFESERISRLTVLSQAIARYRQQHARLPEDLVALWPVGTVQMVDPESGERFGYRPSEDGSYALCATFSIAGSPERGPFWAHGIGTHCFHFEAPTK